MAASSQNYIFSFCHSTPTYVMWIVSAVLTNYERDKDTDKSCHWIQNALLVVTF